VGETKKLEEIAASGSESSVKPDGVGDKYYYIKNNTYLDW